MATAAATSTGRHRPVTSGERQAGLLFLRGLAVELSEGAVHIPGFPDAVVRIRAALADPDAGQTEILKIIGAEPGLALRVLQAANTAALFNSRIPLTDLRSAIARAGHRAVQSAALAFAVQQVRLAPALRSISEPLDLLWKESISVATLCQVIARRTPLSPDEAFVTGLLHGIGRLYIMIRAAGRSTPLNGDPAFEALVDRWHPAIGEVVLENWGFARAVSEAVGLKGNRDRCAGSGADLADVLIAGVALAPALLLPEKRIVDMGSVPSFGRLELTTEDCAAIVTHAEFQLGAVHDDLG
jgi:HD-like signal output (HDOD) protein